MIKAELIAENKHLKARIVELEAALKEALAQLEANSRASKRQAAPFARKEKKANPQKPRRKKGHPATHRTKPDKIDRELAASLQQSCCSAGDNAWLWVFTSEQVTLYAIDPRRAGEVAERILGRDFAGVLTCDCWLAYNPLPYRQQKCLAHLLRHCSNIADQPRPDSAIRLSQQLARLLRAAITLKQQKAQHPPWLYQQACTRLEQALDRLLQDTAPPQDEAVQRLLNLLRKQRQCLFLFLYHDLVPPTNNAAERLIGTAQPGQIRVSQRIAEAARRNYHLEYLGPVKLKGKQHPLPVWTALEPKLSAAPQYFLAHPLVGREAELAQMKGLLAAGLNGTGQILRLEGEAGLGKSHLTAELVRQAGLLGYQTLLAACQSWRKETPYEVWRQLFRALLELTETPPEGQERLAWRLSQAQQVNTRLTQLNPAWQLRLPLLGDVLDLPLADNETTAAFEPQLRQQALFSLVVNIIQNWPNPLLLVIEDAHWLDAASQELTLTVARSLGTSPIVLILVQRPAAHPQDTLLPDLAQLPGASYLHLAELGPESIAALAAHRLQGTPSPLLLGFIQLQAKGNPFFAQELIDALREAGDLTRQNETTWTLSERLVGLLHQANCLRRDESGQWLLNPDAPLSPGDLGLPDSVHGLVLARLDRLLEAHKLTLKVASVIGRIFEFELLTQAHPLENNQEDLLGHLEVVAQREFTRLETPLPRLIYIFKHNITRDVAYNTLLAAQQRQLHLLVAEALETLAAEAIEPLAYHYSRAGAREKALFYLDKAAAKAQREYANETALNYYNQVLGLEEGWVWRKSQLEIPAGQTQSANDALQPAYQLVMAKADKIIDPALRRSFLEQVPLHQEIVAAFQFSHE